MMIFYRCLKDKVYKSIRTYCTGCFRTVCSQLIVDMLAYEFIVDMLTTCYKVVELNRFVTGRAAERLAGPGPNFFFGAPI
jgi:hypothetical protein